MPIIIGPTDIDVNGVPFDITFPADRQAPYRQPFDRVVINNHSPFLMHCQSGNFEQWIHPFMGDIMPFYHQSGKVHVTLELVGTIAGNPHHFCAEFYQKGEDILGRAYPAMMAQFGATLVDAPVLIDNDTSHLIPFTGPTVAVDQFQSFQLLVGYEAANAGPPANTCILEISWFDAAGVNEIWRQTYEINSINSTDCGATRITDAMRGSQIRLKFRAGNGAASTVSYILFGSNRPVPSPRCEEIGTNDTTGIGTDRILAMTGTLSVGAGATVQRNVRLGSGDAIWMFGGGATSSSYDVLLYPPSQGSGVRVYSANYTGTPQIAQLLALPRRALTLFIKNNDGVNAKNVFYSLVVAGEG